ncbi:hypothetical protein OIU85_010158 [Salix viminalis]|uniref:Uncharacterized protein n=1 Tax=Salix viminalis TaxID=40686 RepID=A0A9Q0NW97_SALVM|nr:hypothetical protein OIU85_010158 [Salix viminalis]
MDHENSKKRTRTEFDVSSSDSPEFKLARVDWDANSPFLEPDQDETVEVRVDSDTSGVGLSVIKSFEDEILVGHRVPEMTSLSVGSQTDLGYLLDASDDELGLPPTSPVGLLGLKGEIPNYDSFELGLGGNTDGSHTYCDNNGDFVALGGLFDYSDENLVPADISGFLWQPELSAL